MPSHKRSRNTIDLTQDDSENERPAKTPRSSFQSSPNAVHLQSSYAQASNHGSSDSDLDQTSDGEDDGNEAAFMTQADRVDATEFYEHYGTITTKAVGLRYYRGIAARGETVLLRREPHNQYDANAIQVLNVRGEQIGHIPRQVASKLAPYMDAHDLVLEALLAGPPGYYDVPVLIKTFGPSDLEARERIRHRMIQDRLAVDELRHREQAEKKKRADELKRAQKAAKAKRVEEGSNSRYGLGVVGSEAGENDNPASMDEILGDSRVVNPREVSKVAEDFGAQEKDLANMPETEPPKRLSTKMLPYQRQGLHWLMAKEEPQLPSANTDETTQLWKVKKTAGSVTYTNIATNFSTKTEPKLARGGILADDMGLGKTLEIISLILADKAKRGDEGPTLIVAPVSVMSNWSQQIERHVEPEEPLRVHTYHGAGRGTMKAADFKKFDVVITTYGTLSVELFPKGSKTMPKIPRPTGLYSINWRRVILDEGHTVRNPNTKNALAACSVMAHAKWALTGTPIVNSLKDLYSLIRFIGLTGGLEKFEIFNSNLIRPMKDGQPDSHLLLQALMNTFCLRRRKDMSFVDLRLPELTEYVHRIKFPEHERKKYDALQSEAKGTLNVYKAEVGHGAQKAYRHLLEVLLRLRQVCNHWKMCAERISSLMDALEKQSVVDLTPENCRALQDLLQISIEQQEDCPVCLETLHEPVITHCGHIFGGSCITRVIETQHKCPMCRASLKDETKLVASRTNCGDEESTPDLKEEQGVSAKMEALLKIVAATHKQAGSKIVIFSQWCRFLDLIQPGLEKGGYGVARLDGTMSANKRDTALRTFDSDDQTTIMLASLGVCAVGLNLVAADTVILCDSWWAPAIEDQAVDRVHRLGQTKATTVWRLVMEDSVEERTLEIQKDKRQLMALALKEGPEERKRREGGRSRTLGDIQRLLA